MAESSPQRSELRVFMQALVRTGRKPASSVYSYLIPFAFTIRQALFSQVFESLSKPIKTGVVIPGLLKKKISMPHFPIADPRGKKLIERLSLFYPDSLYMACVHGSCGNGDAIPFSDFDALVVIRNNALTDPKRLSRLMRMLFQTQKYMYQIDPLQHHGWFILTEKDLEDWPQTYLPVEVLEHSRCLVPQEGLELTVKVRTKGHDYLTPFQRLSGLMIRSLERRNYPDNLYRLKSVLSEFMLLPALYVQARDGKGIFKKFSFDAARKDFPKEEWRIMDEVSRIREEWNYPLTGWRRFLLTRTHPLVRRLSIHWAPRIPESLSKQLSPDFYIRMLRIARHMQEKLADDPH